MCADLCCERNFVSLFGLRGFPRPSGGRLSLLNLVFLAPPKINKQRVRFEEAWTGNGIIKKIDRDGSKKKKVYC